MSHNELHIAVVGLSGEFPGAKNIQEFWQNLIQGKETLCTLSEEQLNAAGVSPTERNKENYVPRAGIVQDIEFFDAHFFGYSPREAALIDPQQRKMLEHAWLACEDAAINPLDYEGALGVFAGSSLNTYLLNNILSHPGITDSDEIQQILFSNGADYLATRIAYQLNCRGPALNIQTACSTSLVAIHEACQHLLTYQIDAAIAGGVSITTPQKGYLHSVDGILSPDGHCRPFSNQAQGTIFSNGLGVVVLKRLSDALEDGNPIYAVIRGSATNNDGHQKAGYAAPGVDGQIDVILSAQANANITPDQVHYVETHGTGTQLGDPVELSALQQVFAEQMPGPKSCAIGSLKSNIGHLDVASGVAGFIKTTLALHHQLLPPTLHHKEPTKVFDWDASAFYVNSSLQELQEACIAGVSCFGIGGTNAHVVLQQYQAVERQVPPSTPALLLFSAKTESALQEKLKHFAECPPSSSSLHAIARTLQEGRAHFRYRTALVVTSLDDAVTAIKQKTYTIHSCEQLLDSTTLLPVEQCSKQDLAQSAEQWLLGHQMDWNSHYLNYKPTMVHLSGYPFERNRYWIEKHQENRATKLPVADWFYQPSWKPQTLSTELTNTQTSTIAVLITKATETLIQWDALKGFKHIIKIYTGSSFEVINQSTYQIDLMQASDYKKMLQALQKEELIPQYFLHGLTLTPTRSPSTIESFNTHQPYGLLSCIYLMQAWEQVLQDTPLKLTLLTNRLNRIAEGLHEPHKVPVLAAVKVIPKEYLTVQAQLIDIDYVDHPQYSSRQFRQVVQELAKNQYDQEEIVLRGMTRWIRTYVRTPIHAQAKSPFAVQESKVILITGGLGQLGLDIADYFSQFPQIKLALLTRTPMPHPADWATQCAQYEPDHPTRLNLERLQRIRERGCLVQIYVGDVSNKDNMNNVITHIESDLGPINGVIHAAGETVNGIIAMKTADSLYESYQAKVYGSYHLCELFADKPLDFMILCSSMNAIIGGLGQLDNTAANTFVDYLAEYYAAQTGQPILSINWGAINMDRPLKVNVVPQFADLSTEHKRNRMNDAEVNEVYNRLLTHQFGPRLVISTIDMDDVLLNWNRVASIHDLAKDLDLEVKNTCILSDEDQPQTPVEQWIAKQWAHLLGINAVGRQHNFFTLGGHSLSAVQFMTKLLEHYGVKAHVMNLYELPELATFSAYIDKLLRQKQVKQCTTESTLRGEYEAQ